VTKAFGRALAIPDAIARLRLVVAAISLPTI
jgi:hypothetical protein